METLQRRAHQDLAAYERVETVLAAEAARLDHLLHGLAAELAEVDGGKDPRRGGSPADPEDRMVLASLVAHCRTDAADIEAALARLRAGGYGLCDRCGDAISPERLEAMPECRFCLGCASVPSPPGAALPRRPAGGGVVLGRP